MLIATCIFALLVLASCAYLFLSFFLTCQFNYQRARFDLDVPVECWPSVSQLKPLVQLPKDPGEWQGLRSFLEQDYPAPQQVILALDSKAQISHEFLPNDLTAPVDFSCAEVEAANRKLAVCIPAQRAMRYEYVMISDADMVASPLLLQRAMTPLVYDKRVGMVTCLYIVKRFSTPGALLEALSVCDFVSSVLVARLVEGLKFALGAVMLLKRSTLEEIGGLEAIKDYLADDYQLGYRVAQSGRQVALATEVVEDVLPPMSFKDYFLHQLRWMRTYRISRPGGFCAFLITQGFLWSALMLCCGAQYWWARYLAYFWLLTRLFTGFCNWNILAGSWRVGWGVLAAPVKDFFYLILWALSWLGSEVRWGERCYQVTPEGKLVEREAQA